MQRLHSPDSIASVAAPADDARGAHEQSSNKSIRTPVDVMILTYNEEANLPHALRSVMGWVNNVFVVDSGSTDRTVEVARAMGATVVPHAWEGYARQKNWALDNLPFESPWVFILDADEAITPELREEIRGICGKPPGQVRQAGFYVNRYLVFMGKRIRHCGYFPSWNLRLFKRGAAKYEDRPVHEHMVVRGEEGFLKGLMSHEDRRGLEYYIAKHNRYSTLEAETIFYGHDDQKDGVRANPFGNAVERRRYFKTRIYPRLPARWLGRFVWMYFINLGLLDGVAGLRFCLLISSHELYTTLKLRELQHKAKQEERSREGGFPVVPLETWDKQVIDHLIRDTSQSKPAKAAGDNGSPALPVTPLSTPEPLSGEEALAKRDRSPWPFWQNVKRALWMFARATLFRWSFHNWYPFRRALLRCFGAKIGRGVRIRPTTKIEIPWNLDIGDNTTIGDYAILYSLGRIRIGRYVVVSQYAHLCAGTHDYTDRAFPLLTPPITVGDEAWVAAEAFVGPGVTVGERAVVGARATVVKDVPADQVVAGNPAKYVKDRELKN